MAACSGRANAAHTLGKSARDRGFAIRHETAVGTWRDTTTHAEHRRTVQRAGADRAYKNTVLTIDHNASVAASAASTLAVASLSNLDTDYWRREAAAEASQLDQVFDEQSAPWADLFVQQAEQKSSLASTTLDA